MSDGVTDAGERRAWGWVNALQSGATTPWRSWHDHGDRTGRYLPGAQQLELMRRLNLAGRPRPALVERVLEASAPGRGSPDFELVGAVEAPRFGPPPVDPADLADAELVRVATGLIAEDVVAAAPTAPVRTAVRRPWARPYRLVGDPWLADPVRADLVRRGRPPGGRRPTVVVVGADLATMLAHAWTARAFTEGGTPWHEWLGPGAGPRRPRRTPPQADVARVAATWAQRVGDERVRLVLDPALLPRALGVRRVLPAPPELSADAVDLARRVAAPLGLLVLPERRADLLRGTLLPRLAAHPGPPLALPEHHHAWVARRAARMRDAVAAAGYPVLGDPDRLVPPASRAGSPSHEQGAQPHDAGVLALAVRLLLEGDRTEVGG